MNHKTIVLFISIILCLGCDKNPYKEFEIITKADRAVSSNSTSLECGCLFKDERDGQVYKTVQMADGKCWMAENLKYGNQVDNIADVIDDNTVQKICYKHNAANCEEGATYYLWDEMMNYDVVPRSQGICPEGWIIPNQADFENLMANIDSFNILFDSEFKAEQLGYINNCTILNNCDVQHKPEAFTMETTSNVWEFGNRAWFWTSTIHPSNPDLAYFFHVSDYDNVGTPMQTMPQFKIFSCCVRCIKKQ